MRRALLVILVFIGLISTSFAQTSYKFGVVPQFEPRKLSDTWTPIIAELEKRTGFHLEMVGSARIPEFEQEFTQGNYDFAYMNPYHALVAQRAQKYVPLVRDGGQDLFGVLVVAKDGPIKQLADLEGQTVSFPAPNALGASLLMRADLDRVLKIKIKPMWAQTHTSAYLNVALGRAAAAGGVMGTFKEVSENIRNNLKIIYETRHMPPHPVMAHPRIPIADQEKMRQAFLDLGSTPEGAALLAKVPIKKIIAAKAEDYALIADWGLENYYVKETE